MNPVVAVIAPGAMGAPVGKRMVEHGLKVLTSLQGRSAETIARAGGRAHAGER
jgi:3-hydroxyisobutyrate dehydrogenase-like beta-hydroxyacid dehydrogenase